MEARTVLLAWRGQIVCSSSFLDTHLQYIPHASTQPDRVGLLFRATVNSKKVAHSESLPHRFQYPRYLQKHDVKLLDNELIRDHH